MYLYILNGKSEGKRIDLSPGTYLIGRSPDADIVLEDVRIAIMSKKYDIVMEMIRKHNIISQAKKDVTLAVESAKQLVCQSQFPQKIEEILFTWAEGNRVIT